MESVKLWAYRCERCTNHMLTVSRPYRCSSCRGKRLELAGYVLMQQQEARLTPYPDMPDPSHLGWP